MFKKIRLVISAINTLIKINNYDLIRSSFYILRFVYWYGYLKPLGKIFIANHLFGIRMIYHTKYDGCAYSYFAPRVDYPIKLLEIKYLKKQDVMFDVGSNIGNHALIGLKAGAQVHVFEPIHEVVNLFKVNVLLNNYEDSKLKINEAIVSDKEKIIDFYQLSENITGESSIFKPLDLPFKKIRKKSIYLDNYIKKNNIKEIAFIKIDVEGAERSVIMGMKKSLLKRNIKLIYWETNSKSNKKDIKESMKFLSDNGFRHFAFDEKSSLPKKWNGENNCFSVLEGHVKSINSFFEVNSKNHVDN